MSLFVSFYLAQRGPYIQQAVGWQLSDPSRGVHREGPS